jgi:glycosyltransferase involved in cell wall biosynthesis
LSGNGPIGDRIRELGIPVFCGHATRLRSVPAMILRVASHLRKSAPDIVHTWMYHSDLIGGLLAKTLTRAKIVWHIHHSGLTPPLIRSRTRTVAKVCANLSRVVADQIICCSVSAMCSHTLFGYDPRRLVHIPNGLDLDEFRPGRYRREDVRAELNIPGSAVAIAHIGRLSAFKDHQTFVAAAGRVRRRHPHAVFVLCGEGVTADNAVLRTWVEREQLDGHCRLLGAQNNIPKLLSAMDLLVSSSITEAFPCVVGEAMAMEVPCVVTDAGDAALMVADTGRIVPVGNPQALADACSELVQMEAFRRRMLGMGARERAAKHFALTSVVERIESLYSLLCPAPPRPHSAVA